MTETEWLSSEDLSEMFDVLEERYPVPEGEDAPAPPFPKPLARKLRLFGCACCYRIWHLLVDERIRRVVLTSERFADGKISREKMARGWTDALDALLESSLSESRSGFMAFLALFRLPTSPALAAVWAGWEPLAARESFQSILQDPTRQFQFEWGAMPRMQRAFYIQRASVSSPLQAATEAARVAASCVEGEQEASAQAGLLRDIIGNPYRPTTISEEWLRWADGTVQKLARSIYEERSFEDMPILADALEDAGCDDSDLLAHCRGAGPHTRGCWALDALLGKSVS